MLLDLSGPVCSYMAGRYTRLDSLMSILYRTVIRPSHMSNIRVQSDWIGIGIAPCYSKLQDSCAETAIGGYTELETELANDLTRLP